jgi:hypothetical protein
VKHGRIDVFMNRFGGAQERRKLLKVIATAGRAEVSDNVYGYTAAFSNRAVRLEAVAAEFTSTYSVSREEFVAAVRQSAQDFEYFHEIKCRIDQSAFSEQWEAPAINNIREHFAPSKIITIKIYRNKLDKCSDNRKNFVRRRRMKRFKLIQNIIARHPDL